MNKKDTFPCFILVILCAVLVSCNTSTNNFQDEKAITGIDYDKQINTVSDVQNDLENYNEKQKRMDFDMIMARLSVKKTIPSATLIESTEQMSGISKSPYILFSLNGFAFFSDGEVYLIKQCADDSIDFSRPIDYQYLRDNYIKYSSWLVRDYGVQQGAFDKTYGIHMGSIDQKQLNFFYDGVFDTITEGYREYQFIDEPVAVIPEREKSEGCYIYYNDEGICCKGLLSYRNDYADGLRAIADARVFDAFDWLKEQKLFDDSVSTRDIMVCSLSQTPELGYCLMKCMCSDAYILESCVKKETAEYLINNMDSYSASYDLFQLLEFENNGDEKAYVQEPEDIDSDDFVLYCKWLLDIMEDSNSMDHVYLFDDKLVDIIACINGQNYQVSADDEMVSRIFGSSLEAGE